MSAIKHLDPHIQVTNTTKQYQRKLFWHYDEDNLYPIGNATFIQHKEYYFLLTCYHCVKDMLQPNCLKDIVFFADDAAVENVPVKLHPEKMWFYYEEEEDLVAFELDGEFFKKHLKMVDFISHDLCTNFEENPLQKGDLIFLIGSPYYAVDMEKGQVNGLNIKTTFDSLSFGFIRVSFNREGQVIQDDQTKRRHVIETISGMSGAPAFRFIENPNKQEPEEPFGFLEYIGMLQRGKSESGYAYILSIENVLSFLERMILANE